VTRVIDIVPRQRPLKAMRVLLGATTKTDILTFCPRANVGVSTKLDAGGFLDNERDIRWVMVPHNGELWDRLNNDGDWIVEKAPGHFFIYSDTDLHREYVMA
jgi:hypothetical protein